MASLQKTKARISSIETTKKITKAMELVSSSKLRKARIFYESIQEYTQAIKETFQSTYSRVLAKDLPFNLDPNGGKLYIIITSDLGLCGAYNINVAKILRQEIKPNDKVIIVGSKGMVFLKEHLQEEQIVRIYTKLGYDINFDMVARLKSRTLKTMQRFKISGINVIYTKHINSVTLEATNKQILPLLDEEINFSKNLEQTEFEPNEAGVIKNLLPLYIGSTFFNLIGESKVSEMSSRMTAMKNASNNADEITEYLKLVFNKTRQSNITQEINEIVAGSLDK